MKPAAGKITLKIPAKQLLEIAINASEGIMRIRGKQIVNRIYKPDSTPVTEADLWAHEFIWQKLKDLSPRIPIISEEMVFKEIPEDFWLVDPLDGTKEFISGLDDFTVNIARIQNGTPVFGVVCLPAIGRSYLGGSDFGAKIVDHGVEREIEVGEPSLVARIAVSRSHLNANTETFCSQFENHKRISAGSSLKFCLIAQGSADLYPRFGRTMEWDTAAGQAVLEGAGGSVVDAKSHGRLRYAKPGLENPNFIAINSEQWLSHL